MALVLLAALALQPAEAGVAGRWRSPGGNSIIEIAPCGSQYCGTVAWASDKAKQDARKATEQLVGTQLLTGLEEKSPGRWQGKLFIPDRNLRVTAKVQLAGPEKLKVSGCAVICRSQMWTRHDGPLPD